MIMFGDVREPIDKVLREAGFRSKGKRIWVRILGRAAQIVHLDKSSYGPQNRLEAYVTLRTDIDLRNIKWSDFDLVIRIERIVRASSDFRSALDQEAASIPLEARKLIIEEAVAEIVSVLELASNEAGIIQLRRMFPSANDVFIGPRTTALLDAWEQGR